MSPVGAAPLPTTALPPLLDVDAAAAAAAELALVEVLAPIQQNGERFSK